MYPRGMNMHPPPDFYRDNATRRGAGLAAGRD